MTPIRERAHDFPQPFGFSEIERRDAEQIEFAGTDRRTPQTDRGSRQHSLEAVRYLTLTLQDILAAIQNDPRPQTQEVQDAVSFGDFALRRLRNGTLRRLAENAKP